MTNVVLLGGNGYLGREVMRTWLRKDPTASFYVLSRSGKNSLEKENIQNFAVNLSDQEAVKEVLPESVDYVLDFVGGPAKSDEENYAKNIQPVQVMKRIARDYRVRAMGFVGGIFGPSSFTSTKAEQIKELKQLGIPLAYVEPTVIYGGERNDAIAKMVPLFRVLGIFMKKARPMRVQDVASDLVEQILATPQN